MIKQLFYKLIESWDKIAKAYCSRIKYDNGLMFYITRDITPYNKKDRHLSIESINDSSYIRCVLPEQSEHYTFVIETPIGARYIVPEFTDRVEYAKVLDTIDNSLKLFEQSQLNKYLSDFEDIEDKV